jgi:photosystem II stability/assembly factor-like uncharacterized protein
MKVRSISVIAFLMLLSWTRNLVILHGHEEGWVSVGPEGGTTYALAIDPHVHTVVYAGTNGGVFKSIDGGAHWSPVNAGLPMPSSAYENGGPYVYSLAIDPQNTATVYAGVSFFGDVLFAEPQGGGVYRSDDGGNSWHAANMGIERRIVYSLAIDPATPTTLFAAGKLDPARQGPAQVFRSTDSGASWSVSLPLVFDYVLDLEIDPDAPATVYAATTSGVFKTTDGGNTWTAMSSGLTNTIVSSLAIDRSDSAIVYAGTRGGGVFKSTNGGSSWTAVNTGLTGSFVGALTMDLQLPGTLYAGLEDGAIFKTIDGGATWTPINSGLPPPRIGQSGPGWGIESLAVDPETPTIIYAGTERNGTFKTVNGGKRWRRTTLSSTRVFSIAVNSTLPRVYVSDDRACVATRTDEGGWTFADFCLSPSPVPGNGSVVAFDPLVPTTAYVAGGGLSKTTDGGATWSSVLAGPVFTVALDPVDPSTVYAGGNGARKSVNGGTTWTEINQGLAGGPLQLLVVDPQAPTTLYAGFGGFAVVSGSGSLYKSVDGGSNWALAMEGLPAVGALAIDPQMSSTIYAGDRGSRVFKSINGGESWSLSSNGLPTYDVVALAVHPHAPSIVFAGTYGGGVFESTDGGANWSPMNEQPPNLLIRTLAIDTGFSTLSAGTDGGGVFTIGVPAQLPLTVRKTGRGVGTVVSSPQGIECGSDCSNQSAEFAAGATVTLTATPAAGIVKGWTGCDSDTGQGRTSTCTVTIGAARTVAVRLAGPPIPAR